MTETLTHAHARAIVTPWYALFNQPVRGDLKTLHDRIVSADYRSYTGDGPGESWDADTSIKLIGSFAESIPDLHFEIKELFVDGNHIIVRGEVTGTPARALFGGAIAHSGKSFRILAIDIQTIENGKIAKTYHLENWFAAMAQLRA